MAALSKLRALASGGISKATPTPKLLLTASAGCAALALYRFYKQITPSNTRETEVEVDDITQVIEHQHEIAEADKASKKRKIAVDAAFFRKLFSIIHILVPGFISPEMGYMMLVAASIVAGAYCELWVIEETTRIQASIVARDRVAYMKYFMSYVYAMPLISIIDKLLKYGLQKLKLRFRVNLTKYLYNKYLQGYTYYQMSNLDNRISNPDQLLTQDVVKFCDGVAELYSNFSEPLLTIVLYAMKVTSQIGGGPPAFLIAYLFVSGGLLNKLRQPIARLTVKEQRLEGEFRYVNSRLITNSQEVAFYNGNEKERQTLLSSFHALKRHVRYFIRFKFFEGIIDNIIAKYVATLVGHLVVSRPFLNPNTARYLGSSTQLRFQDYYQSGRMLLRLTQSLGTLLTVGRDLTTLAGFTERLTHLLQVLDDLNKGRYQRTMVTDSRNSQSRQSALKPGSGKVCHQDYIIKFDHVPLVTPNGDVLVEDMSFEVKSGVNVLVCGPNGCGKSSLFRVLGELWPLFGGTLTKPTRDKLFYVPQRPYMTLGTLRDQIIYPDTKDDMRRKRISDSQLITYLDKVQLGYILEREGGWESVQDWMDVLSGGEKQRIAMARLFYHKPQFAILDECTSAVSVDVEGAMYQYCKETGITLFTISHRKSLLVHHEYFLRLNGKGGCDYQPITEKDIDFE